MIKVQAIDHVVLRCNNIDAMLAFYRDMLGCPVERELSELGLIQLRAGSALIDLVPVDSELGRAGGAPPNQHAPAIDHICLQIAVLDEDELVAYLQQHEIEVSEFAERYGAQGHGRSTYIKDPEGNTIELKFELS